MASITVRTSNLTSFQERLTTVNRRLTKHQLPEASVASIKIEFKTRPRNYWLGLRNEVTDHVAKLDPLEDLAVAREAIFAALEGCVTDLVHVVELEVPTDLLQWQGHHIRGRVQREEGGDMVTRIGDHDLNLMQFYAQPFICSHCGTKRFRKAVWVFQREEDGSLLTMGDACAQEYFGVNILALLEDSLAVARLGEDEDDGGPCGARGTHTVLGHLLATFGASLIAFEGYKSRKRNEGDCTSDQASGFAFKVLAQGWGQASSDLEHSWYKFIRTWWIRTAPRWAEYCQLVQDAKVWWSTQTPREEYLSNCKVAITGMNPKHAGFLCCAVLEFMKDQRLLGTAQQGPVWADGWLGEPKTKLQGLEVELVDRKVIDSDYGPQYKLTFRGAAGHCLIWFASSDPDPDAIFRQGMRFILAGTVKKHDQWKAQKQTVLTRCKLLPLDPCLAPGMAG